MLKTELSDVAHSYGCARLRSSIVESSQLSQSITKIPDCDHLRTGRLTA